MLTTKLSKAEREGGGGRERRGIESWKDSKREWEGSIKSRDYALIKQLLSKQHNQKVLSKFYLS